MDAHRTVTRKWSTEEDFALRACYRDRGHRWAGWTDLLPGRSYESIRKRALRLGLARNAVVMERPAAEVMALMRTGVAPSDIDKTLGLAPGTAHSRIIAAWAEL